MEHGGKNKRKGAHQSSTEKETRDARRRGRYKQRGKGHMRNKNCLGVRQKLRRGRGAVWALSDQVLV